MADESAPKKHKWIAWILASLFVLLLVLVMLFQTASWWANSNRIRPELAAPPKEITRLEPENQAQPDLITNTESAVAPQSASDPKTRSMEEMPFTKFLRERLARDPNLTAAVLYIEALQRYTDHKLEKEISDIFHLPQHGNILNPWPVSYQSLALEQIQWMIDHKDFIDLVLRMSRSNGWVNLTREERIAFGTDWPIPNILFLNRAGNLLCVEGWRRLHEIDPDGAREAILGNFCLAEKLGRASDEISRMTAFGLAQSGNQAIADWLGTPTLDAAQARSFLQYLDTCHDRMFTPDLRTYAMESGYLTQRPWLMQELHKPWWNSGLFGNAAIQPDEWRAKPFEDRMEHLGALLVNSGSMMRRKANAPRYFEESEAFWRARIAWLRMNHLERVKQGEPRAKPDSNNYLLQRSFDIGSFAIQNDAAEAGLNLTRAALRVKLQGVEATNESRGIDFRKQPNHPWRDPFSDEALKVDSNENTITIYSVGPDRKDDHGQIIYDPTNGATSAGDIAIRVPLAPVQEQRQH